MLNFLTVGIAIFVFNNSEQLINRLTIGGITTSLVFTFLLGIYEYRLLLPRYLNLSNIKRDFYWGSLLFGFINSILQTGHLTLLFLFINSLIPKKIIFVLPHYHLIIYFLIIGLHFLIYAFANLLTLVLKKLILLIKILLIIIIGLLGYFLKAILHFSENKMIKYFSDANASFNLLLIVLVVSVFIHFIIFLLSYTEK